MKILLQGCETEKRFNLILSLTSIRSIPIIKALRQHYVDGLATELISALGVDMGNFTRADKTINAVAATIESIKEIDWVKHGNSE